MSAESESDVFNFCLRVGGSREAATTATMAVFDAVSREREVSPLLAARGEIARLIGDPRNGFPQAGSPLPVGEANRRLPIGFREVLALRELLGCTYEEIGRIVGTGRDAVAELLWRARLELRDELEGSRLVSIAPLADSCRRALALIVMHWDGELHDAGERTWLQRHLRTCGKCRLSQGAVRQASTSYRDWPAAPLPLGLRESLSSSDPAGRPAAGSGRSSRRPPGSRPRGARRGARRSPG